MKWFLFAFLLVSAFAFGQKQQIYFSPLQTGQSFGEGSDVFMLVTPSPGFTEYEFSLCCGEPGLKGYLGNGFDYVGDIGGAFKLYYKSTEVSPCSSGCTFTGKFVTFTQDTIIDNFCSNTTGSLTGDFTVGTAINESGVIAEYSQLMCSYEGEVFWSSFGGLTVHWDQR